MLVAWLGIGGNWWEAVVLKMFSESYSDAMIVYMSPLTRFYVAIWGWLALIPITILVGSYDDNLGQKLLWITVATFVASKIYAQMFARCPNCRWRIASFSKPFVRSLPPRNCPFCGTDLGRST